MSRSNISDGDQYDAVRMEEEERFLVQLKSLGRDPYYYRKELFFNDNGYFKSPLAEITFKSKADKFDRGPQFIKAMDLGTVKHYSFTELEDITGSFSASNIVGTTRYGRLFKGKINNEDVIVKTWDFSFETQRQSFHNTDRILDELVFLRDPKIKSHPSVVNLVGFHCDKNLAVVYEGIWPEHCLEDILASDAFGWEDRMKVATDIGSTLKVFHDNNHVHGGVHADIIRIDKKFCSKFFQFRLLSYYEGVEKTYRPYEFLDSADLTGEEKKERPLFPEWTMIDDVFSYGILLMELITKEHYTYMLGGKWICEWMCDHPKSIVDQSLDVDEETASKITNLAFDCLSVKRKNAVVIDMSKVVYDLKTILESNTRSPKRQKLCE